MKKWLFKKMGFKVCEVCGLVFQHGHGKTVPLIYWHHIYNPDDIRIKLKFYCIKHRPNFDAALNDLWGDSKLGDYGIALRLRTTGTSNFHPVAIPRLLHKT